MHEPLKNCPFCGEAAKHSFNSLYGDMSMASCKSCGATAYAPKWNRRAVLAKWGQPAQAAEPVAVVVPCYTPSGKRVALCSAKQDLPIGTQLYTAHQPSPTAQAAPAAGAVAGSDDLSGTLRRLDSKELAAWVDRGMALSENLAMYVQADCTLRESQARDMLRAHLFSAQPAPAPAAPTSPAKAAESVQEDAARESEYRRGYRHGYEQRDAEVRGAMA